MAKDDGYTLERHAAETKRLYEQNKLFNIAQGYLLHPSIQRNLPSSPIIAELATGTGDFLIDLAETLPPTARLDAYDISPDSFAPKERLPANMTLNVSDVREPPPDELKGKYDVVCIRFLNAGLIPDDWQKVAQHAWDLLKPGGALQWIEGDLLQLCTPLELKPETKTTALRKSTSIAVAPMQHLDWFITNLCSVLEKVGYIGVKQMIASWDRLPEQRKELSLLSIGAFYAILTLQARRGGEGAVTEEEAERLREEMIEEVEKGAYTRCDMHQFVAWKSE